MPLQIGLFLKLYYLRIAAVYFPSVYGNVSAHFVVISLFLFAGFVRILDPFGICNGFQQLIPRFLLCGAVNLVT